MQNRQEAMKKMRDAHKRSTDTLNLLYLYRVAMEEKDQDKLNALDKIISTRSEGDKSE